MNWESIWQDVTYYLSHGGGTARVWDLLAGGVLAGLGLWMAFELWGRPYRAVRRPFPGTLPEDLLAGKSPTELAGLVEAANRELGESEASAREAAGRAAEAARRVTSLEERGTTLESERDAAGAASRQAEKHLQELETKAIAAREAAEEAARQVDESPSAVSALRAGEAETAGKQATQDAAAAAEEWQRAEAWLARAEAALVEWQREIDEARATAGTRLREAQETAGAAKSARAAAEAVENALRKGRRRMPGRTPRAAGEAVDGSAPLSTAAKAAAKLRARDEPPKPS